ncbi:hypothetical protein PTD2_20722 [Pseudoalteromonas tunicata D2]|uniref:Uncharacterized protein n=1 Tax=Pseudoalteromonas tunicata D2 TaxID=87626 RepID=A4CA70_9GAMM|nr:hypothetical protein PTD2_20722 [Pseudoalteromonas tunicata D2]
MLVVFVLGTLSVAFVKVATFHIYLNITNEVLWIASKQKKINNHILLVKNKSIKFKVINLNFLDFNFNVTQKELDFFRSEERIDTPRLIIISTLDKNFKEIYNDKMIISNYFKNLALPQPVFIAIVNITSKKKETI